VPDSRRNAVSGAARKKWPGNNLPKFNHNNIEAQRELDELVKDTVEKHGAKNFGKDAIRQHILDNVNERRRQVRKNAYDYEKVCKFQCTSIHLVHAHGHVLPRVHNRGAPIWKFPIIHSTSAETII